MKPGRTGIVTVTGFLMESDIMRCLSSKSIYVGVLLHDFRRETEAENSAFRKTEIKEIFRCSTFPSSNIKNPLELKDIPALCKEEIKSSFIQGRLSGSVGRASYS